MNNESADQQARDMLERMSVEDAQSFTTGDLVELANLIATAETTNRIWMRDAAKMLGKEKLTVDEQRIAHFAWRDAIESYKVEGGIALERQLAEANETINRIYGEYELRRTAEIKLIELKGQISSLVSELANMAYMFDRRTQGDIDLERQLAESQAREKELRAAFTKILTLRYSTPHTTVLEMDAIAREALALPQDSTALDKLVKDAQVKILEKAAEFFDVEWDAWDVAGQVREIAQKLREDN